MFDVLVVLALIPLALAGAVMVIALGWLLAPFALIGLGGLGILFFLHENSLLPSAVSAAVVLLGACWVAVRHGK